MQSSSARHIIALLDTQEVPDADLLVLASGLTELLCLSVNCSGDTPAAFCLICLRDGPAAVCPVVPLQSTSQAAGRLLAEGYRLFHFESPAVGLSAGATDASEVDLALTTAERELASSPALSATVELCLLTRRAATIENMRRCFSTDNRHQSFPCLLRKLRIIRVLQLPGYAQPKKWPNTAAPAESCSSDQGAKQRFDQLVEVTTVRRAEPELTLALRAWLLPPGLKNSEIKSSSNRLVFPSNGFEMERSLAFRLSELVLNPGLLADPAALDCFQPLFGPPTRPSRLTMLSDTEDGSELRLEVCGLTSIQRLSPADLFGWPVLLQSVPGNERSVVNFRSLVNLLRRRGLSLLVKRQRRQVRPKADASSEESKNGSTNAKQARSEDTDSSTAAVGPAAYFVLAPTEHLANALVARCYVCDDLLLPINAIAISDDADVGSSSNAEPAILPGDKVDAEISAALDALDSLEQWTPHDLACHWGDYLAGRAEAVASIGREN